LLRSWAKKLGFIKPEMPEKLPFIGGYALAILDHLVKKSDSLDGVMLEIQHYPEDTHREGFVCNSMTSFVLAFELFEHLKVGIEQRFDEEGGRRRAESHRDSMEKLESWYED